VNTLLRHSVIIANNTVSTNNLLNRKWWVEWKNKTILNMNYGLVNVAHLPSFFWVKSINIAFFLMNITPSRSNLGLTPYHILTGDKLDISMLHFLAMLVTNINS
jgi:hypothetical protein